MHLSWTSAVHLQGQTWGLTLMGLGCAFALTGGFGLRLT
jgi:hypothetical protein